ncbi:ubiquinone biosynthesis protein COQ9 precursor [Bisporella sp. PMI_857]|nr:ubiquinone biosynthesis protein COQ9 precursor [Bisporella sp. PMI_857]
MATKLRTLRLPTKRLYHSTTHPPPPGPFTPLESSILAASIPHVPSHGFTSTTLALGAHDAGYLPASTNLFPKGAFSLVHWHLYTQRQALAGQLANLLSKEDNGGKGLGVGGKVKALTWARLMANKEVIHRWQEALAILAVPSNIPASLRELHALSDEIWYLSGDASVDSSWYTKRASLSTIYAASDLFMTTDKSPEFRDTREFLDRRFRDAQVVGGALGSVGQWVGFTAMAGVNVLRSKGVRI